MTVKVGQKSYATRKPQDLDVALIAQTGCNAAEIGRMLTGEPLPGTVARALLPFLAEAERPDLAALASEIDTAGTAEIAAQVARLFGEDAPAPPPPPPPPPPTGEQKK